METIELTDLEREIIRILEGRKGEVNALRRRNLCEMLAHLSDERTIRMSIKHLLTEHGVMIASSWAGYFIPVTIEEVWRTCEYYHKYAMSALNVESKLRKMIGAMIGQKQFNFATEGTEITERGK